MIMLPLSFLISAAALFVLYFQWSGSEPKSRNIWFMSFLIILAFQSALIGVRFGYGIDWFGDIQPLIAAMLPPLAYLSFKRPSASIKTLVYALPIIIIFFSVILLRDIVDFLLALNNLFYAFALLQLGVGGIDAMGWVKIDQTRLVNRLLWLVCAALVISGVTDLFITYDFWTTNGNNISKIAGWASLSGSFLAILITFSVVGWNKHKIQKMRNSDPEVQKEVFTQLENLMKRERLFIDPDINLNRISKRMILPIRDVSRAINIITGQSVSHYINKLRVEEACTLLQKPKMQITAIVYASGFNTKSNFNREFVRIIGKTPSQWRSSFVLRCSKT